MIMDMETSVKMIEQSIKAGDTAFFVDTEIGRIGVETSPKDYIPEWPVEVEHWIDAPGTRWAMKHRSKKVDYHMIIDKGRTLFCTHVRVLQAVSRCLLLRVFDEDIVNEDIIDAAVKVFMTDIDHKVPSVNVMEKEYGLNILGPLVRGDLGVRDLIRDHIGRRDEAAQRVLETGRELSKTTRNGWTPGAIVTFEEGYYRDMLYIILYVANLTGRNIESTVSISRTAVTVMNSGIVGDSMYLTGTYMMAITQR